VLSRLPLPLFEVNQILFRTRKTGSDVNMRSSYEVERWGDSVHAPIVFSACERYSPVISLEYLIAAKCSFLTVPFDAKLAVRSHISIIKPSL
jgi:hypothetical protein